MSDRTPGVLIEVEIERVRQDRKWGIQNHPDGTNKCYADLAAISKERTEVAAKGGNLTWRHILEEEVFEATSEVDPTKLRNELLQVAAVAVAWIECLDRKKGS
jgi:hypothetical protein